MQNRAKRCVWIGGGIVAAGFLYDLLYRLGVHIPCMFHLVTGWKCPGCGVTRMADRLLHFDFVGAFSCNAAVMLLLIPWAVVIGAWCYRYIRYGDGRLARWMNAILIASIVILVLFGILRNVAFAA